MTSTHHTYILTNEDNSTRGHFGHHRLQNTRPRSKRRHLITNKRVAVHQAGWGGVGAGVEGCVTEGTDISTFAPRLQSHHTILMNN